MSITDELREYISKHEAPCLGISMAAYIRGIADRIDAEHESACAEAYGNGVMSVPIALDESAWVELPKDADEVPWNVGDRDEDGNVVIELRLTASGWYVLTDGERVYRPERHSHYHAPTVEDVLLEFGDWYAHTRGGCDEDGIIAEYAAKLRLANNEE